MNLNNLKELMHHNLNKLMNGKKEKQVVEFM